jgi:esterase FrsA
MHANHPGELHAAKAWLRERVERRLHPVDGLDQAAALATIERLSGLQPEPWTEAWGALAEDYAARARAATAPAERHPLWDQAYQAAFLGRYPVPNHPLKAKLYDRAREYFLEATALEKPPLEVVDVPFEGRPGEGDKVRFYLTRPEGVERPRVVLAWGGIDTWKEESHARLGALLRTRGLAAVLIDIPGTGESPVLASVDAERQYTPVFDYLATRTDLDGSRCGVIGASFGGYWAMKLAYTHRDHVAAAVNWGGGVHITFTPQWQERSRDATSYLMDLMAARARIFGGSTFEDYVERCPQLSLLDQGLLDAASSPILLVNGRDDQQNSIDDLYLSLDHGDPKAARVFDGGHMGQGPTVPTIVDWICSQLA